LITGGASGIGAATATLLADRGAAVVIADTDRETGARLSATIGARFVELDVAEPAAWRRLTADSPPFDLVHLNAGITGGETSLEDLSDEHYRQVCGVNLDGVVFGLRSVLPSLRRTGGAVVVTSSMAGVVPYAPDPVYTATKQAVVALVRCLAPDLLADGVTINAVCPGLVDTPMMAAARDVFVTAGLSLVPAHAVAEVVADLAAGDRTGQAITVMPDRAPSPWRFAGPAAMGAELLEVRRAAREPRA
jgi:NAD(P)-dependent dehydrogenase (short-subunit alcohol dehydrogenase family)